MALTGWGSFAEQVAVPAYNVLPMPGSMDFSTAAAFSMTYGTSMHALKQRANLQAGETLLVLGASGGVGLAAVEIGKALGAKVIAAASSAEKLAVAKAAAQARAAEAKATPGVAGNPFGNPDGEAIDYEKAAAALELPKDFSKYLK